MVDKAFSSWIMEVFKASDLNKVIDEIFAHMKTQIENLALANSRVVFDRVLFLDVSFHKLKLTRGSSYLPLPDGIARKKGIINPLNNEENYECFKCTVISALHYEEIGNGPQRISKPRRFEDDYEWGGLESLSIRSTLLNIRMMFS